MFETAEQPARTEMEIDMTNRRELEGLATQINTMGGDVTLNPDHEGRIGSVTIYFEPFTDEWTNHTYKPLLAAELMQKIVAAKVEPEIAPAFFWQVE